MKLVLVDIEEPALAIAEKELSDVTDVVSAVCDVSDQGKVEEVARLAFDKFGAVHLLHNNAGVVTGGPMWGLTRGDWEWVLGVNLWGVINGVSSFVPKMLESGEEGHIVNTASLAGLVAHPYLAPYYVSKHGVVAISEILLKELALAQSKIGVSVLCPGVVNTNIGNAARNRPADLPAAIPIAGDLASGLLSSATPPQEVAQAVIDAVKTNQFWILTHPEYDVAIKARMEGILSRSNPDVSRPFLGFEGGSSPP